MQKLAIIGLSVITAFAFTNSARAAITYSRSPSGYYITSPVTFNVSFDNFVLDTGFTGANYWGVYADNMLEGVFSPCVSTSTSSYSPTLDLPFGNFTSIYILASYTEGNCTIGDAEFGGGSEFTIEGITNVTTIFSIISAASTPTMFTVPTSTATNILANVTSTLGDTGFLTVLAVAAAIPLVFYVARGLISLISHARGGKRA